MGTIKAEQFTAHQNKLANFARAVGHPARIAILEYLFRTNGCVCGDIVDEIGLAQATISQHLKALKEAGLVKGKVEGVSVCYCADTSACMELNEMLNGFFKSGNSSCECC